MDRRLAILHPFQQDLGHIRTIYHAICSLEWGPETAQITLDI